EVKASWASSMHFSDIDGVIDCRGDVTAISGENTLTVDALQGDRLKISLTPGEPAPAADAPARERPQGQGERQLLLGEGFAAPDGPDGAAPPGPAIAERRRYSALPDGTAPGQNQKKLDQFLRVSGAHIAFDAPRQLVSVPGKGEAAVYAGENVAGAA